MSTLHDLDPCRVDIVLRDVAAGAAEPDAEAVPAFPEAALSQLERAGALAFNACLGRTRRPAAQELAAVRVGRLRAGVWGGDPIPGEGPPAKIRQTATGEVLRGVKTFCSGAGGLHCALVLARDGGGPPSAVWIDLTDQVRAS